MLNALEKVYEVNKERKKLLESYVRMIKKSQESLNLIGRSTISNIWERHIIDSIQILNHLPKKKKIVLIRCRNRCWSSRYSFSYYGKT